MHKNGTPSFHPILLAVGTHTYNLATFCDQLLLQDLATNDCTIKDSFFPTKQVLEFDTSIFMKSFDISSLFTSISLTEMLNFSIQNGCKHQTHIGNLTKSSFL